MMVFIPHHEQKTGGVQYHFMLETSLPFSIISYWKRLRRRVLSESWGGYRGEEGASLLSSNKAVVRHC
jgi:hypothetical protein